MRRTIIVVVIVMAICLLLAFCMFSALMGVDLPALLFFYLFCGWLFFLFRVVPQLQVSIEGLLMGLVSLALFVTGLHYFLKWLYRNARSVSKPAHTPLPEKMKSEPDMAPRPWPIGWTVAVASLILLMFVAGISMVGMTHQAVWFVKSYDDMISNGEVEWSHRHGVINNVKQHGLALINYHDTKKSLPPGGTMDANGQMLHSWQTLILPFFEHNDVYSQIDLKLPWNHPRNRGAMQTVIGEYLNYRIEGQHNDSGFALTHYSANPYVMGNRGSMSLKQITDGTSHTVITGEAAGNYKPWGYPANWRDPKLGLNRSPDGFGGRRAGHLTIVLFADGHVTTLNDDIDPDVLQALFTPNGGEQIPPLD